MEHSILLVEDDELLAENIQTYLERKNFEVTICHSAEEALEKMTAFTPDVVLTDNSLPGMSGHDLIQKLRDSAPDLKVIMMTGYGNVEDAVIAMKEGAFHYVTKPVALAELKLLLDKAMATDRMERTLSFYQEREAQKSGVQALIGDSAPMQYLKGTIAQLLDAERRMANTDLPPVLVEGETGTGKELVARALHFDGPRSKGPFIEFNCASIPSNLVESELFGHEKGAFTDAKDRRVGLVEAADGGTLFLDEVGEMDLLLQAKLLKLLEDRTIRRVGSVKERKVDLRVISATNCNLEQMVQQGKFRRDLFFRLRIISIKVPRLHSRGQDILLLARHFLASHGKRYGKQHLHFSNQAEELLLNYSWPGNVRELRNMLEQTVLLAQSDTIAANQLNVCLSLVDEPQMQLEAQLHEPRAVYNGMESMNLPEVERDMVRKMLDKTDWNVTKSARLLGLSRDMLRYRIEKLGLERPDKRQW
ncbi:MULTISPECIES: sigma-54-dependent transcriptional regulator [Pseudomonas]|jgi:two-component system response regulator AtoC|uniref:DNA-binding transcriptional response regulator, NtrC family, contains REC, AAA-type ATPase, and a Fis-type DNA-binding domains n=1 Tax=Pseudomonas psychrophila TaxID=122355 RepID=A0ABY0VZ48_9PSED|nr:MULTISPECIES: sigma-54 dependent transcriptional regulator [Pseudomonas]EPJ93881.1 two component, sigma-54 specific, Fis family transcriptional regulator [Pseudomonas psychrophila]KAB0489879.1 sigma-54-dependent Fis family transcriptional regulator [Pseudomonas psychrophila]KMN01594.1 Fis family transcriptional regulator [Pseudomonas psychrophila]KOX62575.1 Fis family transcriptional regulator [Pseudomonas psychrophila]MDY7580850.1 sigma-54 dependent transcriptional regulator [Pseudomonas s